MSSMSLIWVPVFMAQIALLILSNSFKLNLEIKPKGRRLVTKSKTILKDLEEMNFFLQMEYSVGKFLMAI